MQLVINRFLKRRFLKCYSAEFKNCEGEPNPQEIDGDHSFIGDRALGYNHQ